MGIYAKQMSQKDLDGCPVIVSTRPSAPPLCGEHSEAPIADERIVARDDQALYGFGTPLDDPKFFLMRQALRDVDIYADETSSKDLTFATHGS